jgi:hypothetical protein
MISNGRLLFGLLLIAGLATTGCNKGNPHAPARVSGKVTYAGSPVTAGTIVFHTADGAQYPANIAPDGTYGTELPVVGDVVVTVETESVNPDKKVPTYDDKTAPGSGSGAMAKMYGKGPTGPKGTGKNKAGFSTPEGVTTENLYKKIPAKYADKTRSGLSYTLVKGDQKKDFDLTD